MGLHLISVLGTSLYQPTFYGDGTHEDMYVQMFMVRKFYDELVKSDGRVTILVTEGERGSRKRNWENRVYDGKDAEFSSRWEERIRVKEGETSCGLEESLNKEFPGLKIEAVSIPDGKTPDEIMGIFNKIYDVLSQDETVVFDVTHGYRSIPLLVTSVLNYAKVMKNCSLRGIYYGAFEAKQNGIAPIVDLSLYNEIMEWSFAAKQFIDSGVAKGMKDVYLSLDDSRKNKELWKAIISLERLSDSVSTSRGSEKKNKTDRKEALCEKSIKYAYEDVVAKTGILDCEKIGTPPLARLMERIKEKYSCLNQNNPYKLGLEVVGLCIEFGMISQAYTALEETSITYICEKNGLDYMVAEARDLAGVALKVMDDFRKNKKYGLKDVEENDPRDELTNYFFSNIDKYSFYFEENRQVVADLLMKISWDVAEIAKNIGETRNDINHFGIRKSPLTTSKLLEKITEYYAAAKDKMK